VTLSEKGVFFLDYIDQHLVPWKPTMTELPTGWVAFVKDLHGQMKSPAPLSPIYILGVRYNAERVADQLRAWQVPWQAIIAAHLWEYSEEDIQQSDQPEATTIVNCIKQATLYARSIEVEDLPPLLTPPYEDLGALLLATAAYMQTLKLLQEKSDGRPCTLQQRTSIESIALALRNIFKRLGIWMLKREIEDLSEQLCTPRKFNMRQKELVGILHRDTFLIEVARQLLMNAYKEAVQSPLLIVPMQCNVVGLKRRQQSQSVISPTISLNGFDLVSFNVIVPEVQDCYTAFGVLSQLGHIPERIVDQLTNPKPNGSSNIFFKLQLELPAELPHAPGYKDNPTYLCQLQISTHLMNAVTWYGCLHPSCYPLYTKSSLQEKDLIFPISRLWHSEEGKMLRSICEDLAKSALLPDRESPIIVYDKDRQPVRLPKGVTALDFAYAVDPNIGEYAAEAFVNNRKSPLYRELDAGDVVEIRTASHIQTQQYWIDRKYARTPRALQEIQKSLKRHPQERRGYNQLCELLDRHHYMLTTETLDEELRQLVKQHRLGTPSQYIRLLDTRKDTRYTPEWAAEQIMEQIAERNEISPAEMTKLGWIPIVDIPQHKQKSSIQGQSLCGLCRPEYPHTIMGRIRKHTNELVIHKENCPHLLDSSSMLIPMTWQAQSAAFCVSFSMITQDRKGLIADLSRLLRTTRCDLRSLRAEAIEDGQARICFKVEVHANKEVSDILQAVKKREPGARIEIDAAATPRQILNRLRKQYKQEHLWNTSTLEQAFTEARVAQPSRNTHLRNPFDISHPAPPKMFFGRSQEIAIIQERLCDTELGGAIVLYGPLRSGKSSICTNFVNHHILFDRHARRPVWAILHSLINAQWNDEESIFSELAVKVCKRFTAQFQLAAPNWQEYEERDPQVRFRLLVQACVAQVPNARLIFVLDEFGGAIESFRNDKLPFRFFTFWRELMHEFPQLSLLFALPTSAFNLLSSTQFANVFSFSKSIPVKYLDEIGVQQLLVDPLREQHIEVHPTTVTLARKLTGGSPYYMTMLGQHLIEQLNRETYLQLITDDELLSVSEQIIQENAGNNFNFLKQELQNEDEHHILKTIVELSWRIKQSNVQCKVIADRLEMPVYETRQHLDRLRDGLILDEIGARSNPYYSFKIELVRRWLLHHREFFAA
jgi:(p)ppGpp synthase/HD superfamily hydrolase